MSSKHIAERNCLELLQTDYREAWHQFTVAVEVLHSASDDESAARAHARVEEASMRYRDARNTLADWLLNEDVQRGASEDASRSDSYPARCQAA